jgi:hypothetical protein
VKCGIALQCPDQQGITVESHIGFLFVYQSRWTGAGRSPCLCCTHC